MRKLLYVVAALAAVMAWTSCDVPEYPICATCGDGGMGDGGADAFQPWDAPPTHDACSDGEEICDGFDDDCDGIADEGAVGTAEACSSNEGECIEGTTECVDGELVCGGGGVEPMPETCDGKDNDCDGTVDNGNPGGGAECGTDVGQCSLGVTRCVAGELQCEGSADAIAEQCNGLDDDCDGTVDENTTSGTSCGDFDMGECQLGSIQCVSGQEQCVGKVDPTFEQCDSLDHDCDGDPLNGFDLNSDPRNCGVCGNVCETTNAVTLCSAGACEIALCASTYWDVDGDYANGCEYGPCEYRSAQELCNQADDDCDGLIDEDLAPPDICDPDGACAGTVPVCTTTGWECQYGPDVQTDPDGVIIPESLCDDKDNDCDGTVDESHTLKDVPCTGDGIGICQDKGSYQCDAADPLGPAICVITDPGDTVTAESCNDLDDDCDGTSDEGALTGSIQDWVNVGGGVEMFAYETTRPDATETTAGIKNDYVCSRRGGLPWTNISRPAAEAACATIGARLCTEIEWQRACEGVPAVVTPVTQGDAPSYVAFVEAEDFSANNPGTTDTWVRDTSSGYSGIWAMRAGPNDGDNYFSSDPTKLEFYPDNSPRLDYEIEFTQTGTHYLWVLGSAPNGYDENVHGGIDGTYPGTAKEIRFPVPANTDPVVTTWDWTSTLAGGERATLEVPSAGLHTINIWMREDGVRVDAILLTTDPNYTPTQRTESGCDWSFGTNCNTYAPDTCNGLDYGQNGMTYGGQLASCYTDWGAAGQLYDMSGNVKELTAPRTPGVNPIRGGSFTSGSDGMTCSFGFAVADDDFYSPTVGFRCCRDVP